MATKATRKRTGLSLIPGMKIRHHRYWLIIGFYGYGNKSQALRHCQHLKPLLERAANRHESILGEECWSLVYEVEGELERAIDYREQEIRADRKALAQPRHRRLGISSSGITAPSDWSDRLDLLAGLYHQRGDLGRAIETLQAIGGVMPESGAIEFDGQEMLERVSRGAIEN